MTKLLIVVDMQNDFIDGALGTKEAQDILKNVVKKVENFYGKIIFTRDTHGEDYLSTLEGRNLPVEHCIKNSYGWELAADLKRFCADHNCMVMDKPTFGSSDLAKYIEKENEKDAIEEIQLVGLCTDICVISNAVILKAFLPETQISVDIKCCAGVTPKSHENAIEAMKICQIKCLGGDNC